MNQGNGIFLKLDMKLFVQSVHNNLKKINKIRKTPINVKPYNASEIKSKHAEREYKLHIKNKLEKSQNS